jgi:hypothetical protein
MSGHGGARSGAGRKKGGKNTHSVRDRTALWATIEARTRAGDMANPFDFFIELLSDASADTVQRLHAAVALADRLMPKLKAVEHSGELTQPPMSAAERQATIQALLAQYAPVQAGNGSTGPVGAENGYAH